MQLAIVPQFITMVNLGWVGNLHALIIPAAANAFGIFWLRQYIRSAVPDDLTPSLFDITEDKPSIYDDGCHLDFEQTVAPFDCAYGDTAGAVTVVLMGDSHAAQWFPALELIARDLGWNLLVRTKSSCTPVSVLTYNSQLGHEYWACSEWRENVFAEMEEIRPDMVIFGSTEGSAVEGETEAEKNRLWLDGWKTTLDRVLPVSENVVAIADTPWGNDVIPDCVALNLSSVQECNIDPAEGIRRAERRAQGMDLQREAGAVVIDPIPWFCLDHVCPVIVENVLVYRDAHHISTPYVRSLSALLVDEFPPL
jgi:hypothetical protein